MKVIVAETGGFCMGVKRAMDMILKATEENHGNNIICTYGPLIHNRQVLEMLGKKGVKVAETPEECAGKIVLVRAHGIPPDQRKKLKAVAKKLLDATCPRVARVQALIRRHARKGYLPVIVGDPEHAEVIGLMGYSEGKGIVINKVEDVEKLPEAEKVLVVAQTTQNEKTFNDIVSAIKQRYNNVEVYNTICGSTHQRQEEVKRMAEKVDAMVVVGGYHSGNTIRLAEIARQCGLPTFHVETEKELDVEKLASFDTIGVTAGASTPSWMIRRVVDVLESITHKDSAFYHHILFKSLRMMLNVNVIVSCGAGILSYVAASIAGGSRTFSLAMMSALYVFAMHTVNRYTDKASLRFREPEQVAFYEKWYIPLCVASGAAILLSLFLAYQNGKLAFFLMLLITVLGLLYNVPIIRSDKNILKHINKLKDIPGSKTLFVAGAWGAVTSIIPDLAQNSVSIISSFYAFVLISLMVYVRTAIFDLLDIQGDTIVGKESIPVFIGESKTKYLLGGLILLTVFLIAVGSATGVVTKFSWCTLPSVALLAACLLIYRNRILLPGTLFEALVESFAYLAGIITAIAKLFT